MAKDANQIVSSDDVDPFGDAEIGRRMRAERKRQGISLREVAERIGEGVHLTTVAKLESGRMRVTYEWARKIAAALGAPTLEFFVPEETANQAKAIPVYTDLAWHTDELFSDAVSHYTAMFTKRDDLVAVALGPVPADLENEHPIITAIIDPQDCDLRPNRPFVFLNPELGHHAIGIYKQDPDRMVAWITPFAPSAFLPQDGFAVAGRILEIQRALVSRNS